MASEYYNPRLLMAIQDYLQASGNKILAGVAGNVHRQLGSINISKASIHGVDDHLVRCLEAAVDELKIAININSIDTGVHVPNSRHGHGCAVDINHIGAMGEDPLPQTTVANPHAVALLHLLVAAGFHAGHENGPYPAILLGPVGTAWNQTPVDHTTHAHVSLHPKSGE